MNNRNRCASSIAFDSCGCQDGTEALTTPLARNNRPGLPALSYRIGTHASFLETMKARLSSNAFPELKNLTARDSSDPSIALLDAWAMVADVLTFYQERIANEGYIRTATEERSIQELTRLVGAGQRSGVAATVPLAYTIDPNTKGEVVIPAGSRVQSVPGQNEKPQTFETSEDLKAYAELNLLQPRMSRAQRTIIYEKNDKEEDIPVLYLKGVHANLKSDDRMLIEVADESSSKLSLEALYRVISVSLDSEANRTRVSLECEEGEIGQRKIIKVSAFRTKTAPFGHNAPLKPYCMSDNDKVMRYVEWRIDNPTLNPDTADPEFIIKIIEIVDGKATIEVKNISTGYFEKVSWIHYANENSQDGKYLAQDKKIEEREYRVFMASGISIGEYISLELTGAFGDKKLGDRKQIVNTNITPAIFSVDKKSAFPNYFLNYQKILSTENEDIIIFDYTDRVISDIGTENTNEGKKLIFQNEGVYSIERTVSDKSSNVSLSCVKSIRAYRKPDPNFEANVDYVDNEIEKVVVRFINKSSGQIDDVKWYFGDNTDPVTVPETSYSYNINEPYNVRLVVKGPGGESNIDNSQLTLTFFTVEGELKKGNDIKFLNKSTGLDGNSSCFWIFSDSGLIKDDGQPYNHKYSAAGSQYIILIVTRKEDGKFKKEQYVELLDIKE